LLAVLLPYLWRNKYAWLACLAPLILMLAAAWLLYSRTSHDLVAPQTGLADTIANDLRHLTSHIVHRASESVARRVTFAPGGYLAAAGTLYLAVAGLIRFRAHRS
jgi:hypothetical protein